MHRALILVATLAVIGCSSTTEHASQQLEAQGPAVAPALEPLAFMSGAWTQQQANGAMIEEHWMPPRGSAMLGSFRRILGNGAVPFYEFTQIVAEKDRVVLRQIHIHGNFEPDPKRTEPMELVLERVGAESATFVPAGDQANAGELERITYARDGADMLVLTVQPKVREGKPAEPPLVFRMQRCVAGAAGATRHGTGVAAMVSKGQSVPRAPASITEAEPGTVAYDRDVWQTLLHEHASIRRSVTRLPNGLAATTESDNPAVAMLIKDHALAMKRRMESGARVRVWDPVFNELFDRHDKVRLEVTLTEKGVSIHR